ncbi:hypothetical protein K493DRAFT_299629 [Basidiobolus meristosporus CBS 931.73]|uniref:LysM domain-containing protein n=1 Tax=Basidiobolus meristosporus CBS 931.73 TaxID=1314790 RepID=A0A1Y1YLU9_9FUNG|nr:hypothetical protein K493DRAFT_299629 [Basidiobolus meristosporus CBS 931.73]|eukprot:ORX98989.1 hypothetical protein K493DRAFT_299629 [Basidiobolus meristosporus CBS 931.73]
MIEIDHTLSDSRLARQDIYSEARTGLNSLIDQQFVQEFGLLKNERTAVNDKLPPLSQRSVSSVRFFDASDICLFKANKKNIAEVPSCNSNLSDIPRAKAVILHKVLPSDTLPGISLKYGIEVGIVR